MLACIMHGHVRLSLAVRRVRRCAELVPAAACHAESARRDEAPREHRGGRDENGFCPTRGATAFASVHLSIFEQPQIVTTTPMNGHELSLYSTNTSTTADHRAGYHGYAPSALYGLKDRAYQKRYLVMVLGLRLLTHGRPHLHGRGPARRGK